MAFYICLLSFALCYIAGRRSLVSGLIAMLSIGYVYGITRANLPETASYFIFDSAVLGFYAAQLFRPLTLALRLRVEALKSWMEFLIFWPLIVFFFPAQDLLVRLVGLRTSIFLLPFLLIGARLLPAERYKLALGLAALNLLALAFAGAEFFIGVTEFFPKNIVTRTIYKSNDVLGTGTLYRIPSCFANAHSYGGAMVITVPLLAGALLQYHKKQWRLTLLIMGLIAAVMGVFLSATRLNFVVIAVLIVVLTFSIKSKISYAVGWVVILAAIGWFVSGEARLQRVTDLQDTNFVAERISWSVNMGFFELAAKYPFGNGLGGGGSSMPYFLQDRVKDPVVMENEYARIMLEQGIFGLLLWLAFIIWLLTRRQGDHFDSWGQGRRLAWCACVAVWGTGLIGIGLFTAVPQTCLLLIMAGWLAAKEQSPAFEEEDHNFSPALEVRSNIWPTSQGVEGNSRVSRTISGTSRAAILPKSE
jgi:hypothetical protein